MNRKKLTAGKGALHAQNERRCLPKGGKGKDSAHKQRRQGRMMLWVAIAILIIGITVPTISGMVVRDEAEGKEKVPDSLACAIKSICRLALGDADPARSAEETTVKECVTDAFPSTDSTGEETGAEKTPTDSAKEPSGGETATTDAEQGETAAEENTTSAEETKGEILVLILHTHTTEAYHDSADLTTPGRSLEGDQNMLAVGEALERALKAHGIGAVQCTTYFDYPSVIGAYDRAYLEAEQFLARYPHIRYIVDLHRMEDGGCAAAQTQINGESVAQMRLLVGKSRQTIYGMTEAKALSALLCKSNAALCMPVRIAESAMGQDKANAWGVKAVTVECGNGNNTLEEAKRAAAYLGEALANELRLGR